MSTIKLKLVTEREFNSRQEFEEYCECMVEQKVFTENFWTTILVTGHAGFTTLEKENNTMVTTRGYVDEALAQIGELE